MIALVSYETPFAPCGGIAAVMTRLPGPLEKAAGARVIVISPSHDRTARMNALETQFAGAVAVPFCGSAVTVHIHRHDGRWYFLRALHPAFFQGVKHPYDLSPEALHRDAMFFGEAVPRALEVIAPGVPCALLLQDWEAAGVALAQAPHPHRLYLTLHNSYDSGGMLQRALARVERPVFTVSRQFAADLCEDPLQTEIMAPHLAPELRSRVIGVDNGPFVPLSVDTRLLARASEDYSAIDDWKRANRREALAAVREARVEIWGDLSRFRTDSPWFLMSGRDDPRQKGYDVAAAAAEQYLAAGGAAQFVFTPSGDPAQLQFLRALAFRRAQNVLVIPGRLERGYVELQRGAHYGCMPSFYEPFGMANEFYLSGTPAVARATGGLAQQVVPHAPTAAVERFTQAWHPPGSAATGFLFREPGGMESAARDWRAIAESAAPERRAELPLYAAMVEGLRSAIAGAVELYNGERQTYYRMLHDGVAHIHTAFSWDRAASEYAAHISAHQGGFHRQAGV